MTNVSRNSFIREETVAFYNGHNFYYILLSFTKLLNNILLRKANWIGHILRRNCLLHDSIEGQMTEVKGVERRRTQLDDLSYWELKEEAEDRKTWRRQFINRT